jgi:hypothetical protein
LGAVGRRPARGDVLIATLPILAAGGAAVAFG